MSTTSLTAGEVMDRAAALMNDPDKTDYTYDKQIPWLNMAIDELMESLEESNSSPTNISSAVIPVTAGINMITPIEHALVPHYPADLVELQEVAERASANEAFIPLTRREFVSSFPATQSLLFWAWEDQCIKFNPEGATSNREVRLQYVRQAYNKATDADSVIGVINARSYLAYKTAALCSMFIGENEGRASTLETQAEKALERLTGINNKGRQEIVTRHRPFRAGWKLRGGLW